MFRYHRQITIDVERYGEHYRSLGRRIASASLADMASVLALVDEVEADLTDRLSGSDERAVLSKLDWPSSRWIVG